MKIDKWFLGILVEFLNLKGLVFTFHKANTQMKMQLYQYPFLEQPVHNVPEQHEQVSIKVMYREVWLSKVN